MDIKEKYAKTTKTQLAEDYEQLLAKQQATTLAFVQLYEVVEDFLQTPQRQRIAGMRAIHREAKAAYESHKVTVEENGD